jgi:hypothetical protein
MSKPTNRVRGKTSTATLEERAEKKRADDEEAKKFWESFAEDLDKHSKRAAKAAEVVRSTVITTKVAGRTVPNKTRYVQTVTKTSDHPFKKP